MRGEIRGRTWPVQSAATQQCRDLSPGHALISRNRCPRNGCCAIGRCVVRKQLVDGDEVISEQFSAFNCVLDDVAKICRVSRTAERYARLYRRLICTHWWEINRVRLKLGLCHECFVSLIPNLLHGCANDNARVCECVWHALGAYRRLYDEFIRQALPCFFVSIVVTAVWLVSWSMWYFRTT